MDTKYRQLEQAEYRALLNKKAINILSKEHEKIIRILPLPTPYLIFYYDDEKYAIVAEGIIPNRISGDTKILFYTAHSNLRNNESER